MANNRVFENGWHLSVVVTDPAAPDAGDPVRYGLLTGVAVTDEGDGGNAATETTVDFGPGVWDIPVTDEVGGGISAGDTVFYDDALDGLTNDPSGNYFFGFANEAVGIGLTATVQVIHVPSPGSGTLGAGTIATANLAAGILSADADGRAKIAAGYFAAAAGSRAQFAAGIFQGDKLATGILKMEAVAGGDETGAGVEIAVTGMATGDELVGFFVLTTAAAIATMAQRANTDFTVGDAKLTVTANAADNSGNQYLIVWIDHTP
ncbi:MAG: DUF2190 family protein [Thermoleophilia bacterium]|nr:DUF2190 family protein [Thermoleophilia bacterium]